MKNPYFPKHSELRFREKSGIASHFLQMSLPPALKSQMAPHVCFHVQSVVMPHIVWPPVNAARSWENGQNKQRLRTIVRIVLALRTPGSRSEKAVICRDSRALRVPWEAFPEACSCHSPRTFWLLGSGVSPRPLYFFFYLIWFSGMRWRETLHPRVPLRKWSLMGATDSGMGGGGPLGFIFFPHPLFLDCSPSTLNWPCHEPTRSLLWAQLR